MSSNHEWEDKTAMTNIDIIKAANGSIASFVGLPNKSNVNMAMEENNIRQSTTFLLNNVSKCCNNKGKVQISLCSIKKKALNQWYAIHIEKKNVNYTKLFDRHYCQDTCHNIDKGEYESLSSGENICAQYKGTLKSEWSDMISFIDLYR